MSQPAETGDVDDLAERAERGRVFYEIFPGTAVSDRWLQEFEHVGTPPDPEREPQPRPGPTRPEEHQ